MAKTMNVAIVALWALLGVHLVSCAITTPPMGTPCGPDLIPGIQRMARGVDLTQLDLTNTKGGDGFKKTLIEFTCNKDRKWMMPGTGSQKQYAWPDQVEGVNVVPSGSMTAKTAISEDTEQYKKSLEASVSTSVNALFGSFSASSSVKAAESSKFQKKSMIAETSAFTSAIEVDFAVKGTLQPSLTPSFKEFFSGPVRKYVDAQQEYDSFLDAFGTHYFDKSYLGGFLYMRTEVKEDYFNRERELEVEAKISASYEAIVKGDAQFKVKASDEMKAFLSNSSMIMEYLGGEPLTLDMDKDAPTEYVSRWTKTVFERPHLYSGSLRGIDELIENEALRAEVKKAITIRMYRAYLDSILRLMDIGKVDRSIISDVELLRRQITTAETEERFATLQAGLKRTMDLVLFSAYGKPTLSSMMASWPAVMDVAQCGDAVTALCHRPITPPQAFTTDFSYAQRALAKLADRHWTEYAECRRLISEGRQLWADTYQSLEGGKICPAAVSTFSLNPYCQSPAMPQPPKMMAMKMMMMKMNMHNDSSSTAAAQSNNNNKSNALYF